MLYAKNFLIIGAADRNVGKTQLACYLINKISKTQPIIGLKITTIREMNGLCPRGGEGCGVCSSLQGNFSITEEITSQNGKDTSKMLRAGADKVFWIRCLHSHLEEAVEIFIAQLREIYGATTPPVVCESNSARTIIDPSLFLVLNRKDNANIKKSCQDVLHFADQKINLVSNDKGFDFDTNLIDFTNEKWNIKRNATAIILAGGKSSRMGQNKALLKYNESNAIDNIIGQLRGVFKEYIVSSNSKLDSKYNILQIEDLEKNIGPLMGIYSCLLNSKTEINFIVSCDIPNINIHELNKMISVAENYDAVVLQHKDNQIEPLFAIYKKSIYPYIEKSMKTKKYSVRSFFSEIKVHYHTLLENEWYVNINTPEDYSKFLEKGNRKCKK